MPDGHIEQSRSPEDPFLRELKEILNTPSTSESLVVFPPLIKNGGNPREELRFPLDFREPNTSSKEPRAESSVHMLQDSNCEFS